MLIGSQFYVLPTHVYQHTEWPILPLLPSCTASKQQTVFRYTILSRFWSIPGHYKFYRQVVNLWCRDIILTSTVLWFVTVAEWLVCWTQAQVQVQIAAATLLGNSLRQTVHTHRASVHLAAKMAAALFRAARVTAGLEESNGSLLSLWLVSPAGWLPRTGNSLRTLCSVIEYGLPLFNSGWHLWSHKRDTELEDGLFLLCYG